MEKIFYRNLYFSIILLLLNTFNLYPQWSHLESGTTDLLHSIQFVDNNNGWVVNLNGTKLFHTTNGGLDWFVQKDFGTSTIWNFTFINDSIGYFNLREPGNILKTTNGGANWQKIYTFNSLDDMEWFDENTGWVIRNELSGQLYKTTNGGVDWQVVDSLYFFNGVFGKVGIIDYNNVIVTGKNFSEGYVIFKTTDGGITWTEIPFDELFGGRIQFVNSNVGWIGSFGKLYKTTDGGFNWEMQVSSINDFFFINEDVGWYVKDNQINRTIDGGQSWISQNSWTNNSLHTVYFLDQDNGWISGDIGTILITQNGGLPVELTSFTIDLSGSDLTINWQTATETNNKGFEIQKSNFNNQNFVKIGFVTGNGTTTEKKKYSFFDKDLKPGKYFYRLKQIDFDGSFEYSKEVEVNLESPTKLELNQNYPNPFNPATTIKYTIPFVETGHAPSVQLFIYDILGNKVATLVNEEKPAGSYTIKFDGTGLASGIYFYQLKAGNFTSTKKLILMK